MKRESKFEKARKSARRKAKESGFRREFVVIEPKDEFPGQVWCLGVEEWEDMWSEYPILYSSHD